MLLDKIKEHDPDAVKIITERPIMITIRGPGKNLNEILYEDRWGNQFKTCVEC